MIVKGGPGSRCETAAGRRVDALEVRSFYGGLSAGGEGEGTNKRAEHGRQHRGRDWSASCAGIPALRRHASVKQACIRPWGEGPGKKR